MRIPGRMKCLAVFGLRVGWKLDGPIFGTCKNFKYSQRQVHTQMHMVQGTVVEKGMVQSLHVGLYELSTS